MSEKTAVSIEELDIVRAPGFESGGFEVDGLSPGVNLVYGPNAAGKTTTVESILHLLWPDHANNNDQLVGHFALDEESWRVDVDGGSASYQRNGLDADGPSLPSPDQRDRYRLSLHDLLQQDTRNESFAETIAQESAGGYDVSGAADALGYNGSPITRRKGVYQDADDAVEAWRGATDAAGTLEEERSRLTRLRRELEAAREAGDEVDVLSQAISHREAKSSYEEAQAELAEFPEILEEVNGDEAEQAENLEARIEDRKAEIEGARATQQAATDQLEDISLPEEGVSEGVIKRLNTRRQTLKEQESRRRELSEDLNGAKAKRQSALKDIPLDIEDTDLSEIDAATWEDVSEFARTAEDLLARQKQRDAIQTWENDLDAETEADLKTLERGSQTLEDWLLATPETASEPTGEAAFRIGAVAGGVVTLAGVALGVLVNPLLFGIVLVGAGLFAYGYQQRGKSETDASQRDTLRKQFEQNNLQPPSEWSEEVVRSHLQDLYEEIASQKVDSERQTRTETLLHDLDVESREERVAERRASLREQLGAGPEADEFELVVTVRRILDWQEANDSVLELQESLTAANEHLETARDELNNDLGEYGYEPIADAATATEKIQDLERRQREYVEATSDLDAAEATIAEAESKLGDLRDEHETLYTDLGLEVGDKEGLQGLCEQVGGYEEVKTRVNSQNGILEQEQAKLRDLTGGESELETTGLSTLKDQRRDAEETADQYDELQQQIVEIETRIEEAKKSTSVEDALTEKERALDALGEQLDSDYSNMVGNVLVEHVRESTVAASRPDVFQRADEILTTITHGRYRLDFDEETETFRAYDERKQKGFALDELSSGTRVQVLLAVRVGFVEQQEKDTKLPLILDETLANADDHRAQVIIESMIGLAEAGRQVFYFTAQGDEVAKWRRALTADADIDWTEIDLSEARDLEASVAIPDLDDLETRRPMPPSSTDHDHESYRDAIGVDVLNPYSDVGATHLWYVVEDTNVLHELLELGVERWGELEAMLERGQEDLIPADEDVIEETRRNAETIDAFTQAWQIGRGKPVSRSTLEESGAVSENFIDRVSDLARELNGDAEQLVVALRAGEVSRFRSGKADKLEEYFEQKGYLVSTPQLEDPEIRLRMVERLVENGESREQAGERVDEILERIVDE